MSMELKHKRTLPSGQGKTRGQGSKSVNNPKKGILKKSSSFLSSNKKKPVQFKNSKKAAAIASTA